MRLYAGMSKDFLSDSVHNRIADKLKDAFIAYYRHQPSPAEVRSWRESLRATSLVFQHAGLLDHGIILEYQLPLTSRRLDCMITGCDQTDRGNAVIIELKQWDVCEHTDGENLLVSTWVGGANREVLHPSAQVNQYRRYLQDAHTAFHEGEAPVLLSSCAYLHNYVRASNDSLFDNKFASVLAESPTYTADDVTNLTDYLRDRLSKGTGRPVLDRVEQSRYRPSKKLLDNVSAVIKGQPTFILLDEQLVVYEKVLAAVKAGFDGRKKHVFVIHGGPGTGKSVIAINLMSDLSLLGRNAQYATGSKAFTQTLQRIVGNQVSQQFKYFNSYETAEPNIVDVLICDESHRIRESSVSQYTPRDQRSGKKQIEELIDAAKVAVFLIDDKQIVRPKEVGSSTLIKQYASKKKCEILEYRLEAQFRCSGSEGFVNWISNTLDIERTANQIFNQEQEGFEFRIFRSPHDLDRAIRDRVQQGHTARVTAGFCWPWTKQPKADGALVEDVVIGDYRRPWNASSEARGLSRSIPREVLWAYDPRGIDQVGCIYTAQGFEFDYVGIIWGPDLVYNWDQSGWRGDRTKSHDTVVRNSRDNFIELVKNTYRVLLSRGMKGCYIYFMDKETERFVRSRTEGLDVDLGKMSDVQSKLKTVTSDLISEPTQAVVFPFRKLSLREVKPYENAVPLVDLKLAAGIFSEGQRYVEEVVEWVELPPEFRPQHGLFVAQVVGESMNRRIPNGSWCLFRKIGGGTRQGKVVVARHREISDVDTGGHFTVKVYESQKVESDEGGWRHEKIILRPDTTATGYEPIVLNEAQAHDLKIIAELVAVLS